MSVSVHCLKQPHKALLHQIIINIATVSACKELHRSKVTHDKFRNGFFIIFCTNHKLLVGEVIILQTCIIHKQTASSQCKYMIPFSYWKVKQNVKNKFTIKKLCNKLHIYRLQT